MAVLVLEDADDGASRPSAVLKPGGAHPDILLEMRGHISAALQGQVRVGWYVGTALGDHVGVGAREDELFHVVVGIAKAYGPDFAAAG